MKFTKLKVVWRFEFAGCQLYLSLDFEKHRCFFYFIGSGEPTKSEMHALELLVHTYDNSVGAFPKTGLKQERAYCVDSDSTSFFDLPKDLSSGLHPQMDIQFVD